MPSKRRADRQMTKDDKDDGDNDSVSEQEVTYGFTKASEEEISTRRIVRARRPALAQVETATEDKTTEDKKEEEQKQEQKTSNPFASIQLKADPSTSVFGASTGFRGFASLASKEGTAAGSAIFGASSGFQGFGSLASSSSSNGFGADTQQSSAPATFGGFASLKSSAASNSFTFGSAAAKDETLEKTQQEEDNNADRDASASNQSIDNNHSNAVAKLPEDYVLESGEEGYQLELELRCKSYRWMKKVQVAETKQEKAAPSVPSTELFTKADEDKNVGKTDASSDKNQNKNETSKEEQAWVEQGIGPARILQIPNSNDEFARLTQRRQAEEGGKPTKLLINLLIGRESTADPHTDKVVRVSSVEFTDEGSKPVLFLFRFKDAELATQFLNCLKKVISQTKSFQQTGKDGQKTTETAKGDK